MEGQAEVRHLFFTHTSRRPLCGLCSMRLRVTKRDARAERYGMAASHRIATPLAAAMSLLAMPAIATQQLIPAPYPEQLGPNAQETQAPRLSYHQHLIPQPAPWAYGPNALGNPKPYHRHWHQRLLEDPYPWLSW